VARLWLLERLNWADAEYTTFIRSMWPHLIAVTSSSISDSSLTPFTYTKTVDGYREITAIDSNKLKTPWLKAIRKINNSMASIIALTCLLIQRGF
jgi:hypothetical protein